MPKHEYGQEGAYRQNEAYKRLSFWLAPLVLLSLFLVSVAVLRLPAWVSVVLLLLVPAAPALAKGWQRAAARSIDPCATTWTRCPAGSVTTSHRCWW